MMRTLHVAHPTDPTLLPVPHATSVEATCAALGVDPSRGLDPSDAVRRSAAAGPNELDTAGSEPLWRIVVEALTEPFVILLAVAGGLAVLLGETRDGLLVLGGLVPIVVADVVTEYRGERALEALRAAAAPVARVRRSGASELIPAASVVPGDVVLLQAGDVVPADLRVSRSDRLTIDRSALTGESVPEPASTGPDAGTTPLIDRRSMAYAGTSVVGGRGEGVVVAIGRATEFGRIAGGLATRERRRSPLQLELDRLVRILLVVAIALIAVTSGLGFVRGHPLGENLLAGISAAIAAIPEEPPVLLAVILGLGAYRLLRRGVLVRRLNAQEVLGAVDLIITDKTGTITQNRLAVASIRSASGDVTDAAKQADLLNAALQAEEDAWHGDAIVPGSFTRALRSALEARGALGSLDRADLRDASPATEVRPFSETAVARDGHVRHLRLGAPEVVLAAAPGSDEEQWHRVIVAATGAGERLLGLAERLDGGPWAMRALIGFADAVRPGISDAIALARRAGIQVIVVTGDHPQTARAIARQVGLEAERIVTGEEVRGWDDDRLAQELPTLHVVARSTPEQKRRLVDIARRTGRVVAVTGDGVNDAPALHGADVAVAMGSGTAVARESSDLVLGDDSFATLLDGLAEGRRIVDNVQKGLVFLISTHVAFLGFILLSTIAIAERQVLLPIQILWMELFIDLSASIAFEREPGEPRLMTRPPRIAGQPLLTSSILANLAGAGGFTAIAALVAMLLRGDGFEHAAWLAYTVLVVSQCVRAYFNRSVREPVLRLGSNAFLAAICVAAVAVQVAIPFVPPLAEAFRATTLDGLDWLLVIGIAFAPAVVSEVVRRSADGRISWVA